MRCPASSTGWTVRYTTDLTDEVWFYLRGEEYSAQIDYFAQSVQTAASTARIRSPPRSMTDRVVAMMLGADDGRPSRAGRRAAPESRPRSRAFRMSDGPQRSTTDAYAMDRVLFGDNQFFGVNHMSEEKARAQAMRFQDLDAIIDVLDAAYEEGIRTFMCTSHDRVARHLRPLPGPPASSTPTTASIPCMPYAHKYANAVTEHGMIEALRMFLPQEGAVAAMLKGGMALANKDIEAIMQLLIDAEMKMFHGLSTPVVFMQNVITDLLLGLRMNDALPHLPRPCASRYGAEPGFITMNVPRLLDVARRARHRQPDRLRQHQQDRLSHVRRDRRLRGRIASRRFRPIAMSVFASGAIPPREAIEYVCAQPRIESIVFGASGRANIRQTKALIDEATRPRLG